MASRSLQVLLTFKDMGGVKGLEQLASKASETDNKFSKAGAGMLATSVAVGSGLYLMGKGAAELEQAVGGTAAVFGEHAGVLDEWAKGADTAAGLSEQSARRLTTSIGGALQGLGYAQDEAAEKSKEAVLLGADLAATYGGTTADAVAAYGSALRGEFDPLERFNIFLKQSTVDQKAVEMGLAKNTQEVDKNARAQATLALITEQSGAAQGQFARESTTASGQMAIMEAQVQNSKDAIGAGMLPVMAQLSGVLGGAASRFTELDSSMGGSISTGLTWATVLLGAAGAVTVAKTKTEGLSAAIKNSPVSGGTFAGGLAGVATTAGVAAAGIGMISQRLAEMDEAAAGLGKQTEDSLNAAGTWDELLSKTQATKDQIAALDNEIASARWNPLDIDYVMELEKGKDVLLASNDAQVKLTDEVAEYARVNGLSNDAAIAEIQAKKAAERATRDKAAADAEATAGMTDAEKRQYDLAEAVKETEKAYKEAATAVDKFWNPGYDLAELEIAAMQAHQDLTDAIAKNGVTLDISSEAGRANRLVFMESTQAATEYGLKILENGGTIEEATTATNNHIAGLRQQMEQAGFTKASVDLYIASLKLTPEQVAAQFSTPGLAQATTDVGAFATALDRVRAVRIGAAVSGIAASVAGYAKGGGVDDGWFMVGEEGPELGFKDGSNVQIIPNGKVAGYAAGTTGAGSIGGDTFVTVNVYGTVTSEQDLADTVQTLLLQKQAQSPVPILPGVS